MARLPTLAQRQSNRQHRSTFTTWHPVALPDWRATTPLGVLDSDDVHLSSAQEGHAVRLFAIRAADTGRFDDAEIDWEWSHAVDDSNNRVWINLDDEVEGRPICLDTAKR